jgi:hypothetical protein
MAFSPVVHMDHAAYNFRTTFADGSTDFTSPHRKGFRFIDTNNPNRRAAACINAVTG